jgi:thiol-disulfide isomerase/thioredoxin
MKKVLLLAIIALMSACAGQKEGLVTITGKINNPIPQGEVLLERFEVGQAVPVTTVNSDHEGNFEIEVAVDEPGFYRINVYGQQFETLVLNKDNLKVVADGQGGNKITVTGSKDMEYLAEVNEYMRGYGKVVTDFNQRYMKARQAQDTQLINKLTDEGMALENEKVKKLKKMAWSYDKSLVALLITDFFQNKTDEYYFLDSLSNKLSKEIPNSSQVEMFANNLEYFRPAVAMGDVAPEITLPDVDGEERSLSDLRGKYVLLDFWAGWCGPCRRENPNVVAMYDKYSDKGFEVFSVSLDRTRDRWVGAIAKDGLRWDNHVSDLSYFQSEAAITYKVNSIPFALLLDPEGRVIGKNLRGRALQAKLASIFGE